MTKQVIEVDIPEGYEIDNNYSDGTIACTPSESILLLKEMIRIKKKQPERIIFEKSFEKRKANPGEYYLTADGSVLLWDWHRESYNDYDILTKVEE